jgi:toxin YoeB
MNFNLDFSSQAQKDIQFHKFSGNKIVLKKILILLNELSVHPFEVTGKPEKLKYDFTGFWSRRINLEHRLIYEVVENTVFVLSLKGHY